MKCTMMRCNLFYDPLRPSTTPRTMWRLYNLFCRIRPPSGGAARGVLSCRGSCVGFRRGEVLACCSASGGVGCADD